MKEKTQKKGKIEVKVLGIDGTTLSSQSLPEGIFDVTASDRLLAQYIRVYLANQRQGTHKTKSRGEIALSTQKIYRQKGTGRARHGAKSAPIFVGGGVAHGVHPKSYALKLNKKQRRKALFFSLSQRIKDNSIVIIKGADAVKGTTKEAQHMLVKCGAEVGKKVLFVYGDSEKTAPFIKGMQNLQNIIPVHNYLLNAYEVTKAQMIFFTEAGINDFIAFRGFNKP